jgi:hypothetical protein
VLNEEYIYDKNGRLDNAGFLDYRTPLGQERGLDYIAVLFATPEAFPILANTLQHKRTRISALGAHETGLRDVATTAHPNRLAIAFSIHKIAILV